MDCKQVNVSNKCPETSRIAFIHLPDHGPAEELRADGLSDCTLMEPVRCAMVSPAYTRHVEGALGLFFASFKYFSCFRYQKEKNTHALRQNRIRENLKYAIRI